MIEEIVERFREIITSDDYRVYSAFDSIPYNPRNDKTAVYVSIPQFSSQKPVYTADCVYIPFSAVLETEVIAPPDFTSEKLFRFFKENILFKVYSQQNGVNGIKSVSLKPDTNLRKLVLKCEFYVSGMLRKDIYADC